MSHVITVVLTRHKPSVNRLMVLLRINVEQQSGKSGRHTYQRIANLFLVADRTAGEIHDMRASAVLLEQPPYVFLAYCRHAQFQQYLTHSEITKPATCRSCLQIARHPYCQSYFFSHAITSI